MTKSGIEKKQEKIMITTNLLRVTLARSPWVSNEWQYEVAKLFSDFDERGEIAVEVAFEDSNIPNDELEGLVQACNAYGFHAIRDAILNAMESKRSNYAAS